PPSLPPFPYTTLFRSTRPCRRASHTTSYVSSAVSLANARGSRPPSQSEVFDDQLGDLSGRRPDVDADCRLIRGGFFEIGELAVKDRKSTRLNSSHGSI